MKSIILIAATALILPAAVSQQKINNTSTATVKIYGNCSMCKAAIEKAATKKKVSAAVWDKDTKTAGITYNNKKTNLDVILKNIAYAGYDNQSYLAPDEAYNMLPECCRYERKGKPMATLINPATNAGHPVKNQHKDQHGGMNGPTQETDQLQPVFDSYFALKDALVKTDANTAAEKAKALRSAIDAVKMEKLAMDVHMVWMKVLNGLKEDADHINGTKDITHQREHFMTLSKNVYDLIKADKPSEAVYYQFCPMADDGKGAYWLSKESAVKNPYYGSQMLSCGKTVETIKQ